MAGNWPGKKHLESYKSDLVALLGKVGLLMLGRELKQQSHSQPLCLRLQIKTPEPAARGKGRGEGPLARFMGEVGGAVQAAERESRDGHRRRSGPPLTGRVDLCGWAQATPLAHCGVGGSGGVWPMMSGQRNKMGKGIPGEQTASAGLLLGEGNWSMQKSTRCSV